MSDDYIHIDLEETYDDMIWFRILDKTGTIIFRFATLEHMIQWVSDPHTSMFYRGWSMRSAKNSDKHEIKEWVLDGIYSGISRYDGVKMVCVRPRNG